ncbi:IS4 family transposase, partial [Facilibium subflavum]|uniref:IS4 family transposase n=1 Tax=Facilibium subflavum TaxID=2219058 RepID=UPI0013C338C0
MQSVNLAKISKTFATYSKQASVYKRIQRFMKRLTFSPQALYHMICQVFELQGKVTLCMDRTNWKFGKTHINYLVISIAYKGIAIPFIWKLLTDKKRGNSDFNDRKELFDQLLRFIPVSDIDVVLCDREFIDAPWMRYLKSQGISFVLRAKENLLLHKRDQASTKLKNGFKYLSPGRQSVLKKKHVVLGCEVYLCAKRLHDGRLLTLVSDRPGQEALTLYKRRWEIETLFAAMKKRGFNWEQTHM